MSQFNYHLDWKKKNGQATHRQIIYIFRSNSSIWHCHISKSNRIFVCLFRNIQLIFGWIIVYFLLYLRYSYEEFFSSSSRQRKFNNAFWYGCQFIGQSMNFMPVDAENSVAVTICYRLIVVVVVIFCYASHNSLSLFLSVTFVCVCVRSRTLYYALICVESDSIFGRIDCVHKKA